MREVPSSWVGAPPRIRILLASLLLSAAAATAESRVWTAQSGATVEAEWVSAERGQVTLRKVDGKLLGIPLNALSEKDQTYVREKLKTGASSEAMSSQAAALAASAEPVSAGASVGKLALGGVELKPGDLVTFLAPLPPDAVKELKKEKNTIVTEARVGVAIPVGFDPSKPQRVLVASATSDGNSSSVNHAQLYKKEALALGWVVLAGDPPNNELPKDISHMWRWGLIQAGLEELHRVWPASKTWAYAAGGFSGGAKRSGYIAAIMANAGYEMIGMYMGGCNHDLASHGLREYRPNRSLFLRVPTFISNGTRDTVSTVQHAERVRDSLRTTGFKHVRLETYDGDHALYRPHTTTALSWFDEMRNKK